MKETNKNEEIQKEMVEDKLPIQQHQNQFGGTVERNENIEVQNQIKVNNSEKNGTQSEKKTTPQNTKNILGVKPTSDKEPVLSQTREIVKIDISNEGDTNPKNRKNPIHPMLRNKIVRPPQQR